MNNSDTNHVFAEITASLYCPKLEEIVRHLGGHVHIDIDIDEKRFISQ